MTTAGWIPAAIVLVGVALMALTLLVPRRLPYVLTRDEVRRLLD